MLVRPWSNWFTW